VSVGLLGAATTQAMALAERRLTPWRT